MITHIFSKLKTILFSLLVLILMFLPDILIAEPWFGKTHPWQQIVVVCLLAFLLLAWGIRLAKKEGFLKLNKDLLSLDNLALVLSLLALSSLCDDLGGYWLEQIGQVTTENQAFLEQEFAKLPVLTNIILSSLLGPFAEELVARGYWMKKLFGAHQWLGLIVSSLIFAWLHVPSDLPSWFIYTSAGLILGSSYLKTQNLAIPIAIHILNNTIATLSFYLL